MMSARVGASDPKSLKGGERVDTLHGPGPTVCPGPQAKDSCFVRPIQNSPRHALKLSADHVDDGKVIVIFP
jgi:hypothetical protein